MAGINDIFKVLSRDIPRDTERLIGGVAGSYELLYELANSLADTNRSKIPMVNWVTVVWVMAASASMTLAAVHGLVWLRRRSAVESLLFCLVAIGTAGMAVCELWMMNAKTAEEFGLALKWFAVPLWLMTIAMVGFIHFYLGSDRAWLGWAVCGLRTVALLLNFVASPNVYYSSIEGLRSMSFLGTEVTVVDGMPNPLMLFGQLSLLLLAAYVLDATLSSYRRGEQRRALSVGSSMVFFVLALSLQTMLVLWNVIDAPVVASLFFLGIVATMGAELSNDLLRAAKLAEGLQLRERELQAEREVTDAIFKSAPGIIFLEDEVGHIVRWSAPGENGGGTPSGDRLAALLFRASDVGQLKQARREAFELGRHEFELDLKGRGETPARYFFRTVRVSFDGQPHIIGVGIDVNALRQLAFEAAKQKEELAHLTSFASLSELSSSLAHELNQPLAIILTNAQAAQRLIAQGSPDIGELREILADIVSADIRAADVIKRLRSILQHGDPLLEPVDPAELIAQVLRLAKTDLEAAGVSVSVRHPRRLPEALADRVPVEQVFLNLIKNAIEAMEENGTKPRQLSMVCGVERNALRFSIRDNGCGLPEDSEKIFEAFRTTKSNGLGLGLTICQTIIKAHGGKLHAERNKSRGATFHFTLPLAK